MFKVFVVWAIIMLMIPVAACVNRSVDSGDIQQNKIDCDVRISLVDIDGHSYIIVENKHGDYGGGVMIIHNENCWCKRSCQPKGEK